MIAEKRKLFSLFLLHHLGIDNAGGSAQLLWSQAMSGLRRAQPTGPSRSGT